VISSAAINRGIWFLNKRKRQSLAVLSEKVRSKYDSRRFAKAVNSSAFGCTADMYGLLSEWQPIGSSRHCYCSRARRRDACYLGWTRSDQLIVTPGDVIDFGQIEADLLDFMKRFLVREIAYDPGRQASLPSDCSSRERR